MLSDRMEDAIAKSYSEFRDQVYSVMRANPSAYAKISCSLTIQDGVPVYREVTAATSSQLSKDVDKKKR